MGGLSAGTIDEAGCRKIKQLGVDHVLTGGPKIPWDEAQLKSMMDKLKAGGLTLGNLMIAGFPNTIYGRPGRDEEIDKVTQSIRVAGKVGLPVVEYNFYAHRIVEGYYEETGRAGAGLTAFDNDKVKDLPPLPNEGAHTLDEMWANITYFLKAVIPVAEQSGVRLALHPNDPPAPLSRGSGQIMGTVEGWKHLIEIVKSPSNGITFDCGVTREMGHDPVEGMLLLRIARSESITTSTTATCKASENRASKVPKCSSTKAKYSMFSSRDEGAGKTEISEADLSRTSRALDDARERPGFKTTYPGAGGYAAFAYNVGYARAMMQAALTS